MSKQASGAIGIFLLALAYCVFMSLTQSFHARCEKAGYEPNTAAFERCIDRTSNGGPVFEENIGRLHG